VAFFLTIEYIKR